jgi:hypothetical protein
LRSWQGEDMKNKIRKDILGPSVNFALGLIL